MILKWYYQSERLLRSKQADLVAYEIGNRTLTSADANIKILKYPLLSGNQL